MVSQNPIIVTIGARDQDCYKLTERLGVRIAESSRVDSVIDKEQMLSEGHSEAEDRKMDFEDLTDDDEVALNLPQKGRPTLVIEEPRGLGPEATGV